MLSEHDPAHHYRAKMNPEFIRRARIKQRERERAEHLAAEAEKRRLFALNYAANAQAKLAKRAAAAEAKRAAKEAAKEAAKAALKEEEARKAALAMKATQAYRIIIINQATEEKQPARCIIERVSTAFGIPYREVMGASRTREVAAARQVAMYEVRKARPDLSLPQIGRIFGRDHTTVIHAVRKVEGAQSDGRRCRAISVVPVWGGAVMDMVEKALAEYRALATAVGGCGDGNCVVVRPKGQHTNGGCRCSTDRYKAQRMMMAGSRLFRAIDAALSSTKESGE